MIFQFDQLFSHEDGRSDFQAFLYIGLDTEVTSPRSGYFFLLLVYQCPLSNPVISAY